MSPTSSAGRPPLVEDRVAVIDPELHAVLDAPFPLRYRDGGGGDADHPEFVRAASAVRRWGDRRVVIQDDVNVLAIGELGPDASLQPLLLPRGDGGRRRFDAGLGNKAHKLDLEAAAVLPDGRLIALGSGTTAARERIAIVTPDGTIAIRDGRELYAALRAERAFAGTALNLEGAVVSAETLLLFQRGNGAADGDVAPVNAIGELALAEFSAWLDARGAVPALRRIVRVDLGREHGVRLGFTDATLQADGTIAFLACAEDSIDAVDDGEVVACRFGVLDELAVRITDIVDASGQRCRLKLEGIEARFAEPGCFDVVADMDDPEEPACGAVLRVARRVAPR